MHDTLGSMIKLADNEVGSVSARVVEKRLTELDRERLREGEAVAREMLKRLGARPSEVFLGTLNAGHPGGMLPLTEEEAQTVHHDHLPPNLYVADATLLPRSLGKPPILTIVAQAKRVAKLATEA